MVLNPCCCMTLQRATSFFAVLDAVLNFLLMFASTKDLVVVIMTQPEEPNAAEDPLMSALIVVDPDEERIQAIVINTVYIVSSNFQILLALYLRRAARKRNPKACRRWLIMSLAMFVIGVISYLLMYTASNSVTALLLLPGLVGIVYKAYELLVVFCFMLESKSAVASDDSDANINIDIHHTS